MLIFPKLLQLLAVLCFLINIMHTHSRSSWLLWQSSHPPGQCLDPTLISCRTFPLSFSLSLFFSFSVKTRSATTDVIPHYSYFQLMFTLNLVFCHANADKAFHRLKLIYVVFCDPPSIIVTHKTAIETQMTFQNKVLISS